MRRRLELKHLMVKRRGKRRVKWAYDLAWDARLPILIPTDTYQPRPQSHATLMEAMVCDTLLIVVAQLTAD